MEGQLKKLTQTINVILLLGSIAVSGLMLVGYSYNMGYLSGVGLSTDALAYSFYDSVAAAFYMGVLTLIGIAGRAHWVWFGIALFILFPFVFYGWLAAFGRIGFAEKTRTWAEKWKSNGAPSDTKLLMTLDIYEVLHKIFCTIGMLFAILMIMLFIIVSYYQKGFTESKEQREKFEVVEFICSKLPEQKLACTRIRDMKTGKLLAEGLLIAGTANSVAIFDGKQNKVFRRSADYSVEVQPAFP